MLKLIATFLTSGTFRRWSVTIAASTATVLVPWIQSKLGVQVSDEVMAAIILGVIAKASVYVVQSMSNEKHARDAGAAAATQIATVDDAVLELSKPLPPAIEAPTTPGGLPAPVVKP